MHLPVSKLFSYHFLIWSSQNSSWPNKNDTHNKTQLKITSRMLSFSAPPAHIYLPHLASLYSLDPRNFKVSVTYFCAAVYPVDYSFICVHVASSDSSAACSTCRGWLFLSLLLYIQPTPCLTHAHTCMHTHSTAHPNLGHCLCLLSSHSQSPPQSGARLFCSTFRALVGPSWGSTSCQNRIHRNLSL